MANLTETLQWEPSVNQLEVVDHLVGGPDGVLNTAARQLANRTIFLKSRTDALDASALAQQDAITAHGIAVDPHPQYLTPAEGNLAYDVIGLAAASTVAAKAYADSLVVGLWDDRGSFNASVNTFPTAGGSGAAGAILKGDVWTVSVVATAGVLLGIPVGSTVRALVDTPAQTVASWDVLQVGIGYVPENAANKDMSAGYVGKTLEKINLWNTARTFMSFLANAATAARTYTFPDRSITVAGVDDVTGGLNAGSFTTVNALQIGQGTGTGVSSNTIVGNLAQPSATTAQYNSIYGYNAGNAITTGQGIACFGLSALAKNTTGLYNTAFGFQAGYTETVANANETGNYNTWIGFQSGPGVPAQLNNSIAIGYLAKNSNSNEIVLGNANITSVLTAGMFTASGGFSSGAPVTNAAATLTLTAATTYLINTVASTLTLPTASTVNGKRLVINVTGAFAIISASANIVPLTGGAAGTAILPATAGKWAELVSNGTNWQIMSAN